MTTSHRDNHRSGKWQFTIRSMLVVTAISAVGMLVGKKQYDRWHWVNNPIEFHPYSSLVHVSNRRPVLIVFSAAWEASGSLEVISKIHLRSPELQYSLYDKQVLPVYVDCTENTPESKRIMDKFGVDRIPLLFLLSDVDGPVVYAGLPTDADRLRAAVDGL